MRSYLFKWRRTNLQSAGRELVKRLTSAVVIKPDASSSNASEMGCNQARSTNVIAHASGLKELSDPIALVPMP
jgi:hypothetical protein